MIPAAAFDALCCGARKAVSRAWHAALMLGHPDETDHVYQLMRVGVPVLVDSWAPTLAGSGIALRVTGVFCHQTPFAHFPLPGATADSRCELGDLLIVHQHRTIAASGEHWVRRAALMQAKMTDRGVCGHRDDVQEYLYSTWPRFSLKGRGPSGSAFLAGQRDFRKDISSGRYALIAKTQHFHDADPVFHAQPFCCGFPWWIADPTDEARTAGAEDAGAFIANMLFDTRQRRGRAAAMQSGPLALTATPNNHFDVTIEELMRVTAARTLASKNGQKTGQRGQFGVVCFQAGQLLGPVATAQDDFHATVGDGVPDHPPEDARDDDGGISLLLIETVGEATG